MGANSQIWEQYAYPTYLKDLLAGNSSEVAYKSNPVIKIDSPQLPEKSVWINKTGSTKGFGAYVASIPGKRLGIVLLANRNYPNDARIIAAHRIFDGVGKKGAIDELTNHRRSKI